MTHQNDDNGKPDYNVFLGKEPDYNVGVNTIMKNAQKWNRDNCTHNYVFQ